MKPCPGCGREVPDSADVCESCRPERPHPLLSALPLHEPGASGPDLGEELKLPVHEAPETPAEVLAAAQSPETGFSAREIASICCSPPER